MLGDAHNVSFLPFPVLVALVLTDAQPRDMPVNLGHSDFDIAISLTSCDRMCIRKSTGL